MPDTDTAPVADTDTQRRPNTVHARCCKPADAHGLCRQGDAPSGAWHTFDDPAACVLCVALWRGGHWRECPLDGLSYAHLKDNHA